MCDAQDIKPTAVRINPLSGDRVEVHAVGARNAIREVLGAPNSTLDVQSDLVGAIEYTLAHEALSTGTELLLRAVLAKASTQ